MCAFAISSMCARPSSRRNNNGVPCRALGHPRFDLHGRHSCGGRHRHQRHSRAIATAPTQDRNGTLELAFALTEPEAGSDAGSLTTTASRRNEWFRLARRKALYDRRSNRGLDHSSGASGGGNVEMGLCGVPGSKKCARTKLSDHSRSSRPTSTPPAI